MKPVDGLSNSQLLGALSEVIEDQRRATYDHVEERLESIVGLTKEVEAQGEQMLFKTAEALEGALDIYLHHPISYRSLPGPTPHPLFMPRENPTELIEPVKLTTLSPDWIQGFIGPNL